MAYPPPVSNDEKTMLRQLARRTSSNPINYTELEAIVDLKPSVFGNGIAHLVAGDLIRVAYAKQSIFRTLAGKEPESFVFITEVGQQFLASRGHTTAEEDAREAALSETPEDRRSIVEEAVRIYDDSFSKKPIYDAERHRSASAYLDSDIREEIEIASRDREKMWDEFEERFGHRGGASSDEEANFRDPIIRSTTVRTFRAMDEQLHRKNLPMSRKPGAWATHYNNGDVGLRPAIWEDREDDDTAPVSIDTTVKSTEESDQKIEKIIEVVAGSLSIQMSLMDITSEEIPAKACDAWSLGYIGGYSDAFFQKSRIGTDEVGLGALLKIFMELFGQSTGAEYLGEFIALQQVRDDATISGMFAGGGDAFAWMKDNDVIPMKWANYVRSND